MKDWEKTWDNEFDGRLKSDIGKEIFAFIQTLLDQQRKEIRSKLMAIPLSGKPETDNALAKLITELI